MFYVRKYADGGLTRSNIEQLFESAKEEECEAWKMQMRMQGIDPDGKAGPKGGEALSVKNADSKNSNVYEYGDRSQFDHMTEEEQKAATASQLQQLMGLGI